VLAYFAANPSFSWGKQSSILHINQCLLAFKSRRNVSHPGESKEGGGLVAAELLALDHEESSWLLTKDKELILRCKIPFWL
jgi:hypothetical protein